MKKISIALLMLVSAASVVSCRKENFTDNMEFTPLSISAVAESINDDPVKAVMAFKYDILWSENDKIYVVDNSNNHDTFTLTDGEQTTRGTFTQDGTAISFEGEVQAYYPSTLVQEDALVWPACQTNDQTVPLYSKKSVTGRTEEFSFTSLGSVLQIVFNSKQADVTLQSIEIWDGEKAMSGSFTVDGNGQAIITATGKAGITLDLGESGVALGDCAHYFNISVPAGDYKDLTLTFIAKDGTKCVMSGEKVNISHNTVGRITLSGKEFKSYLPGKFTVDQEGNQVQFSQGNLYYDGSKFKFEAKQYDFQNPWDSTHISHFYWSKTDSLAYAVKYNEEEDVEESDIFFTNATETTGKSDFTVNGETGKYRILSAAEWQYLLMNHNYKWTTVCGRKGYALAPDGVSSDAIANSYATDYDWRIAEREGIVFIPAAGCRWDKSIKYAGFYGYYWFPVVYNFVYAYRLYFSNASIDYDDYEFLSNGSSVRLITECQ